MENNRTNKAYATGLYEFTREVWIICPACSGRAIVRLGDPGAQPVFKAMEVRCSCIGCGFNKTHDLSAGGVWVFGVPRDPVLGHSVWLQAECAGHVLWAYNPEHLAFLRQQIAAKLRERNGLKMSNSSLGARLPRWMTAAKNREEILKTIEKLSKSR